MSTELQSLVQLVALVFGSCQDDVDVRAILLTHEDRLTLHIGARVEHLRVLSGVHPSVECSPHEYRHDVALLELLPDLLLQLLRPLLVVLHLQSRQHVLHHEPHEVLVFDWLASRPVRTNEFHTLTVLYSIKTQHNKQRTRETKFCGKLNRTAITNDL